MLNRRFSGIVGSLTLCGVLAVIPGTPLHAQSGAGAGSPLPVSGNPWRDRARGFYDWGTGVAVDRSGNYIEVGSAAHTGSSYDFSIVVRQDPASLFLDPNRPQVGVSIDFGSGISQGLESYDWATSVVIDSQGRIVVAGYTCLANQNTQEFDCAGQAQFAVARLNPNATLDATFGAGGTVVTGFGADASGHPYDAYGYAVAVDAQDRVIVAGAVYTDAYRFALVRYNTDGSLDQTFGSGGRVTTDFQNVGINTTPTVDEAFAVAVDASGRIVVAGSSMDGAVAYDSTGTGHCVNGCPTEFALARYNADGTLDVTFGAAGRVLTTFGGYSFFGQSASDDIPTSMVIDPAGRILVAGYSDADGASRCGELGCPAHDFALARYLFNGTLDPSFGQGGLVLTDFNGSEDLAYGIGLDSSGRIVVSGQSYNPAQSPGANFAVVRYLANGALDGAFGSAGKVTADLGNGGTTTQERGGSLLLDALDRIVVAGSSSQQFAQVQFVGANANLSVTTSASPNPALAGGTVTFGSIVTNIGPESGHAIFQDQLPPGFDIGSASASQGTCDVSPREVSQGVEIGQARVQCSLGVLAPGASVTVTFQGVPTLVGTFTNTAAVLGSDASLQDNRAQVDVTVVPAADLTLGMTVDPVPVAGGGTVVYTMAVTNNGPSDATNVTLADDVLDKFELFTTTQGGCGLSATHGNGGVTTMTCVLGTISAGGTATVTLAIKAPHKKGTLLSNTATVSATEADPDPSDNTATIGTVVK